MKDLNIVFVNYHMRDDILAAIASVRADIANSTYDVAINVVDNSNNADGIENELPSSVSYMNPGTNLGFGKANNLGFQRTPARYYFSLNPDTLIPQDSKVIDRLIAFMDANKDIGCIAPKLKHMDETTQLSCYRFNLSSILIKPFKQLRLDEKYAWVQKHTDKLLMKDFDHNTTQPVDWVLGAAMIVRQEVVDEIGWYDDRFFMYLEDADWCRRMWDANWSVYYVHDIVIKHRHSRGSAKVPGLFRALFKNKLARIHTASWFKYLWKWRGKHKYVRTV